MDPLTSELLAVYGGPEAVQLANEVPYSPETVRDLLAGGVPAEQIRMWANDGFKEYWLTLVAYVFLYGAIRPSLQETTEWLNQMRREG